MPSVGIPALPTNFPVAKYSHAELGSACRCDTWLCELPKNPHFLIAHNIWPIPRGLRGSQLYDIMLPHKATAWTKMSETLWKWDNKQVASVKALLTLMCMQHQEARFMLAWARRKRDWIQDSTVRFWVLAACKQTLCTTAQHSVDYQQALACKQMFTAQALRCKNGSRPARNRGFRIPLSMSMQSPTLLMGTITCYGRQQPRRTCQLYPILKHPPHYALWLDMHSCSPMHADLTQHPQGTEWMWMWLPRPITPSHPLWVHPLLLGSRPVFACIQLVKPGAKLLCTLTWGEGIPWLPHTIKSCILNPKAVLKHAEQQHCSSCIGLNGPFIQPDCHCT